MTLCFHAKSKEQRYFFDCAEQNEKSVWKTLKDYPPAHLENLAYSKSGSKSAITPSEMRAGPDYGIALSVPNPTASRKTWQ